MNYPYIYNSETNSSQTPSHKEKNLEYLYYSKRAYTERSIKLHRKHLPLNPKLCINTQKDYEFYIANLLYLNNQLDLGVEPKWMVSFHYQHPVEHCKHLKETDKLYGFGDRYGFKSSRSLWNEVSSYNYWSNKRNDEDQIIKDASQIRNSVLKWLYGIKRFNQTWKHNFPNLLFFHEKGKTKLLYHTHLLLPKPKNYDTYEELYDVFNTTIRQQRKCVSKWKRIDITPVIDKYNIVGYLNKETTSKHISFDPFNSIPIV